MTGSELRAATAALAGEPVDALDAVPGGGNNRLYRVHGPARAYALKRYAGDPDDARERYEREFGGLAFVWQGGERRVPEPVALDAARGLALYAWVDGERIARRRPGDVDALTAFLERLHALRTRAGARALLAAREAVFAPAELHAQIRRRLARLRAAGVRNAEFDAVLAAIDAAAAQAADGASEPLEPERRTLSPSDFGTHNALRTGTGLVFVDFEYFGWDDPVKLVADALWHPGMELEACERRMFYARAADVYGVDRSFGSRFERAAPLYGLRWALIVLNEFLPAMWARRVSAGESASREAVLERQLAKAAALIERVQAGGLL